MADHEAPFFLTTDAIKIWVYWRRCRLAQLIQARPLLWASPLSPAILINSILGAGDQTSSATRSLALRTINEIKTRFASSAQYPYPGPDALEIWSQIRSVDVTLSGYADGNRRLSATNSRTRRIARLRHRRCLRIPLLGPAPTDPETLDLLAEVGINFASLPEMIARHAG